MLQYSTRDPTDPQADVNGSRADSQIRKTCGVWGGIATEAPQ